MCVGGCENSRHASVHLRKASMGSGISASHYRTTQHNGGEGADQSGSWGKREKGKPVGVTYFIFFAVARYFEAGNLGLAGLAVTGVARSSFFSFTPLPRQIWEDEKHIFVADLIFSSSSSLLLIPSLRPQFITYEHSLIQPASPTPKALVLTLNPLTGISR